MPHLQEKNDAEEKVQDSLLNGDGSTSTLGASRSELPIKEAREGYLNGSEGLMSLAASASASKRTNPVKFGSSDSAEERTPQGKSFTPRGHPPNQSFVTPSPHGAPAARNSQTRYGPMLSIYGNTRLITSPIRVKRKGASSSEDDKDAGRNSPSHHMTQPTNLRYGNAFSTPTKESAKQTVENSETSSINSNNKRQLGQVEFNEAVKKAKIEDSQSEYTPSTSVGYNYNASPRITVADSLPKKKPIISPTSSGEKVEDDESTGTAPRGGGYPFSGRPYPHPSYHPPHPYGAPSHPHSAYGAPPPPYGSGYPMYSGYPPPPPPHYMSGHPPAPYYPPYPPHPSMMHHYRGPSKFGQPYPGSPHRMPTKGHADQVTSGEAVKTLPGAPVSSPQNDRSAPIKSVAEWQRAAMTTGKPPSANRCIALTEPIPSKYWGEAEKTKDVVLPDFHRLVNFPDYLAKARNASCSESPAGKKNCVMCGKLRVCSASSLVGRGRAGKPEEISQDEDDGTAHIIPRQNKGLCTACDVTVWVVVSDSFEIKWCKGCKNFRPWAAFGDKGSATKCVRCRDRQREKYAMQKDEIRLRRYKRSSGSDCSSPSIVEEKKEDDKHMAAARGLRTLMNAATTV